MLLSLTIAVIPCFSQNPNIILIMTDDQGWGDVGFNGNTKVQTPHLDGLAKHGIILDRFYSASPVCSPTRASVLTGQNPFRLNIPHANTGHLAEEEITLPELLRSIGYQNGFFGKWHLGTLTTKRRDSNRGGKQDQSQHYSIPTMHGFDVFFCTEAKVPTYDPMLFPTQMEGGESKRYGWKSRAQSVAMQPYGTSYWNDGEVQATSNLTGDDSRIIMDRVLPFIESAATEGSPFFTAIWFHTPHLPVSADSSHRGLYTDLSEREQLYYGSITAMDEQVGRLWSRLEELGIADETMLWFCSDNGPENDTPGTAGRFRERKRSLYEGGVRVPAFVIYKNNFPGGIRMKFPAVTSDYLPTIVDILRIDHSSQPLLDGESILPLLLGKTKKREKAVGFLFEEKISWVKDRYKLISTDGGLTFELYDLVKDQAETKNIITRRPKKVIGMKSELDNWMASVAESQKLR